MASPNGPFTGFGRLKGGQERRDRLNKRALLLVSPSCNLGLRGSRFVTKRGLDDILRSSFFLMSIIRTDAAPTYEVSIWLELQNGVGGADERGPTWLGFVTDPLRESGLPL